MNDEEKEYHKIIIGKTKNVSPGHYYVTLRCELAKRSREIATFKDFNDARKFGVAKAKELELPCEEE